MDDPENADRRLEMIRTANVVTYTWNEVRSFEAEGKDYPFRDHVQLLASDSLPPFRKQTIPERLKKMPRQRQVAIGGADRIVKYVAPHSEEAGVFHVEGIDASSFSKDIAISKGYGPCTFIAGFRDNEGFLTHNLARGSDRFSVQKTLDILGIARGASDVELYIGAGLSAGDLGAGGSGTVRRSSEKALSQYRLPYADIGGQSTAPIGKGWKSTSVLLDPQSRLLLMISDGDRSQ